MHKSYDFPKGTIIALYVYVGSNDNPSFFIGFRYACDECRFYLAERKSITNPEFLIIKMIESAINCPYSQK